MASLKDRIGQRFGRLKVVSRAENGPGGKARWNCLCDCGSNKTVNGWDLAGGRSQSCGCLQSERTATSNVARTKHGHARDGGGNKRLTTPEYRSWKAMLERCRNPNAPNFHLYGGRGIAVCDRWLGCEGFVNFLADMGKRPKGQTIDRRDTDGDYTPDNCRWATAKTQAKNRRHTPEYMAIMRDNLARGRAKQARKKELS